MDFESYRAARGGVALIDLSEDAYLRVSGDTAEQDLEGLFSMELALVGVGRGISGMFLNESGHVIAAATIFRQGDDFIIFTDRDGAEALISYLRGACLGSDTAIEDLRREYRLLSVLGPQAQNVMAACAGEEILGLPYLTCEQNEALGAVLFRMGYSGEYEYRILCAQEQAQDIESRIMSATAEYRVHRGQRDVLPTMMLEMRSLGSADIPANESPVALGLHWMVAFRKDAYPGKAQVRRQKSEAERKAVMVVMDKSATVKAGTRIAIESRDVGYVSCVRFSPTLGTDIGLAMVDRDFAWVGVQYHVAGTDDGTRMNAVSAPLFVTRTVKAA
jgi:aminomethyltransferase